MRVTVTLRLADVRVLLPVTVPDQLILLLDAVLLNVRETDGDSDAVTEQEAGLCDGVLPILNVAVPLCDTVCDVVVDNEGLYVVLHVAVGEGVEVRVGEAAEVGECEVDGVWVWVVVKVPCGVQLLLQLPDADTLTELVCDCEQERDMVLLEEPVHVGEGGEKVLLCVTVESIVPLLDAVLLMEEEIDPEIEGVMVIDGVRDGEKALLPVTDMLPDDVCDVVADSGAVHVDSVPVPDDVNVLVRDGGQVSDSVLEVVWLWVEVGDKRPVRLPLRVPDPDTLADSVSDCESDGEFVKLGLTVKVCTSLSTAVGVEVQEAEAVPEALPLDVANKVSERDCVPLSECVSEAVGVGLHEAGEMLGDNVRDAVHDGVPAFECVGDPVQDTSGLPDKDVDAVRV